jgi:hypothetical protein
MASLQIENIPESLLKNLFEAAAKSGRSVNELAVEAMKLGVQVAQRDRAWVEERLAAAAALRASMPGVWITNDDIRAARDEGRE